jgi:rod shape-determining protein MreD
MIMRPGQQLLLPVNPFFMWGSLVVALLVNMLLNMGWAGRAAWSPDLVAVVLVFWTVHQPMRVNIGAAFVLGLMMDTHQGGLLGQHAMAYSVLSYFAITIHRRLLWFSVPSQATQVLPLFLAAHGVELALRMFVGGAFPGIALLGAPLIESVLWTVATVILLAPQRRAPDPDANRPI